MAQTNREKQAAFRKRNADLGRFELRGVYATPEEQEELKALCRDRLKQGRKAREQTPPQDDHSSSSSSKVAAKVK